MTAKQCTEICKLRRFSVALLAVKLNVGTDWIIKYVITAACVMHTSHAHLCYRLPSFPCRTAAFNLQVHRKGGGWGATQGLKHVRLRRNLQMYKWSSSTVGVHSTLLTLILFAQLQISHPPIEVRSKAVVYSIANTIHVNTHGHIQMLWPPSHWSEARTICTVWMGEMNKTTSKQACLPVMWSIPATWSTEAEVNINGLGKLPFVLPGSFLFHLCLHTLVSFAISSYKLLAQLSGVLEEDWCIWRN